MLGEKLELKTLVLGTGRADCNEARRGLSDRRQKTPLESFTLAREKCQFFCPPPLGLIL